MDNNANEKNKREADLDTATKWLGDAQEWIRLAGQLNSESAEHQKNIYAKDHKLTVACACAAMAFQMAYKALLVAADKWPREKDGVEKTHKRLRQETQREIEKWIEEAECEVGNLLKNLDKYTNGYGTESGDHQFDIPALACVFEKLVKLSEQNLTAARKVIERDRPDSEIDIDTIHRKIGEIARRSEDGDYIYRGEPEHYDKVSSNLYRHYEGDIEAEHFQIEIAQDYMLEDAKQYAEEGDDFQILTQLQHYGGKTNLIDFTTDYLIALFFACDGSSDEDGRVLLFKQTAAIKRKFRVTTPRYPQNRVIAQKSIFVRPPEGFINPDKEISIPRYLKSPMLDYLRKHHGIYTETIYNDLHGFIINQNHHQSAYTKFFSGLTYYEKGEYSRAIQDYNKVLEMIPDWADVQYNRGLAYYHEGEYKSAIEDFSVVINFSPNDVKAYNDRGNSYRKLGKNDCAIQDYNKAIELQSDYAKAHYNRGLSYTDQARYDHAIQDFNKAIELKPDWPEAHNNRGIAFYHKREYTLAIEDFSTTINIKPNHAAAYNNRGNARDKNGKRDCALKDYSKTIELNPDCGGAYYNRGLMCLQMADWEKAESDLNTAKNKGIDIVAVFHRGYGNVTDFERKNGVQLPEDIVILLQSR